MTDLLRRAFDDPGFAPLPDRARALLETLGAPPRLGAHLRVVHDVAVTLTGLGGFARPRFVGRGWLKRPNVALVASDAPNATLGALDAPNATLGRSS